MTHTAAARDVTAKPRELSRPSPAPDQPLLPLILTFLLLLAPVHVRAQADGGGDAPGADAGPESGVSVEEQLAGQISVAQAANRIARAIRAAYPGMSSLLVYNDGDIRLLLVYGAVAKRIDAYTTRYANLAAAEFAALAADPAWTGPGAPCDEAAFAQGRADARDVREVIDAADSSEAAADSAAKFGDALSLFRAGAGPKPGPTGAGETVVVTEVFRALREQYRGGVALYYPAEMPPGFDPTRDSQLLGKLEALFNAKANAESAAAQVSRRVEEKGVLIARLQKCRAAAAGHAQASAQRLAADVRRLEKESAALRDASAPLAALDAQAELLARDLTRGDGETGPDPLAAFLRAEMIQKFVRENDAYWLKLRVVASGGSARVRSNLFADLFKGGGRVWYSGASIVEYHLYDRLGRSLLSDTTNSYEEYREARDFKKLADDRDEVDQR